MHAGDDVTMISRTEAYITRAKWPTNRANACAHDPLSTPNAPKRVYESHELAHVPPKSGVERG